MASSHLQALVGPKEDTLNQQWSKDKSSSFGFKMMMKMGWSDGKGLGKELQGAATHVTVTKKTDSAGLGTVKDETGNMGWTEASASFDNVFKQLNARYGSSTNTKDKNKKKKKDKKNDKKKEKKESKRKGATASMLLRHPKLLQSKNIRAYSAHDMSAILGIKRTEVPEVEIEETSRRAGKTAKTGVNGGGSGSVDRKSEEEEEEEESSEEEREGEESTRERKNKEKKEKKKRKREQQEDVESEASAAKEEEQEASSSKKKDKKKKKKCKNKEDE